MNRESGLIEPLALQADPGCIDENGPVEAGMVLVFNDAGIVAFADLEGPGMTDLIFR
jgi:hypothetical protein